MSFGGEREGEQKFESSTTSVSSDPELTLSSPGSRWLSEIDVSSATVGENTLASRLLARSVLLNSASRI
jgi:hypothetical protein